MASGYSATPSSEISEIQNGYPKSFAKRGGHSVRLKAAYRSIFPVACAATGVRMGALREDAQGVVREMCPVPVPAEGDGGVEGHGAGT